MDLNSGNKKVNYGGKMWFRNGKTGEWSPVMQVESIECQINLTDDDEANLASLMVPLGELEIVSNGGD